MTEIRPSLTHFASTAWGRNISIALAALAAMILALFGSRLGIVIVIALVLAEGSLALRFMRSRIKADSTVLVYIPPIGPTKKLARSRLQHVEIGRPMMGVVGRAKRMVFAGLDGQPLLALDSAVWSPDDVARIAAAIGIPVADWREPKPRSGLGHALRLAVAAAGLVMIVAAAVTIVVVIVLVRNA